MRRVTLFVREYVVGFDPTVCGGETHVVVVECGGTFVVDDVWTGERGFRCFLPVFPACDDAFASFSRFVPSGLHQSTVESVRLLAHIVVGFVVQCGLAGGDILALESVVYDVLCRPEERVYGVFEECGIVAVHVECNGDGTPHVHILYVELVFLNRWGSQPATIAWFESAVTDSSHG
ncbi:IS1341-type transposase (plasmid) [Natrarchaeobaculum sulfurireducens]|uniref:IS1341-type transposase n=1 Tax=Natrarchaeobaculum sulfurireducens TaxID=2044521 RepID=A0A346PK45_9EURY|nr:IS1341-type transposase [Natrarchaeobaculum sulfurireducens]